MRSKLRLVLAGLTAAALIGGLMVADPADAGKKKKHHHKKVKVVKVHKGDSVKQVSKGGDATAGNGGAGGTGGSSGTVNNTGNVVGSPAVPAPAPDLSPGFVGCINGLISVPVTDAGGVLLPGEAEGCAGQFPPVPGFDAFVACLGPAHGLPQLAEDGWTAAEVTACLNGTTAPPSAGGSVFSGNGGAGATGGNGGNATGGTGGNNTNTRTRTVTGDDHSIDVDA